MRNKNNIFFIISGFLILLTIISTIASFTKSIELSSLEKKESQLISERRELEDKLVKTNSTKDLAVKSVEMGFTQINDIVYITEKSSVANLP